MSEQCHLKDCGEEAVIGTTAKWGPEYKVAMCESHVMERIRRIAEMTKKVAELETENEMLRNHPPYCDVWAARECSCGFAENDES